MGTAPALPLLGLCCLEGRGAPHIALTAHEPEEPCLPSVQSCRKALLPGEAVTCAELPHLEISWVSENAPAPCQPIVKRLKSPGKIHPCLLGICSVLFSPSAVSGS